MENERREKMNALKVDDAYEQEEEEEDEEEKIEKFFAIIRSFRDARDRRRNELKEKNNTKNNNKQKQKRKQNKRKAEEQQPQSSWVPTFQLEDFTQDLKFKSLPSKFPAPCNNNHDLDKSNHKDRDSVLDLQLTL